MPTSSSVAGYDTHTLPAGRARALTGLWLGFTAVALGPFPPVLKLLVGACVAGLSGWLAGQRALTSLSAYGCSVLLLSWALGHLSLWQALTWAGLCALLGIALGRHRDLKQQLTRHGQRRKAAETELRTELQRKDALLKILPDTVCRIDRVGSILSLHVSAEDAPVTAESEISQVLPRELVPGALESINAALATSDTIAFEFQREGAAARYEARLVRGGPHEVIAVFRNISQEAKLRRALGDAQQDALQAAGTKGRFLATMSHQIRNPMNGVVGMTNVLLQTKLTPEQREQTTIIRNSAEALLSILDDVLDYTKIEAGTLELAKTPFPLRALLEEVSELLSMQAHANGVEVVTLIDARIPDWVQGDRGRVRQVITNLMGNAVKFTSRGYIALRATLVGQDRDMALIRFDVEDTGVGIASEQQKRLFQDFSQANLTISREFGGTGLGLSICRQIVEAMGGNMQVESAPGRGSVFSFTARLQMVNDRTTGSFLLPRALRGAIVGTLPMHPLNHELLRQQLTPFGASVVKLESPAALQERLRSGEVCDVVVLSLPLHEKEGAAEERIRELHVLCPSVPLVALYSSTQRAVVERAKQAGAAATLARPLRRAALHQAMVLALGIAGRGHESRRRAPGAAPAAQLTARVLVVEDNLINQKVAVRSLEMLGCEAQVADNGQLALDALTQDDFDIVLMDCQMPIMDGYEAASLIRKIEGNRKRTPIIAMTANAMQGDRERCLEAGMDDYLPKPVTLAMLDKALRKWLPDSVQLLSRTAQASEGPAGS